MNTKTVVTADDGAEFETEAEALAHERVSQAEAEFDKAAEKLNRALAGSVKTADGKPFEFGRAYHVVTERLWAGDVVREYFDAHNCKINRDGTPCIVRTTYDKGFRSDEYYLSTVFVSKVRALLRLLELRKERLASVAESITTLEKQITDEGGSLPSEK